MNIKAMIPVVIAVVVALIAWEMFIKKAVIKGDSWDETYDDLDELS